jgi:hypothetical protein
MTNDELRAEALAWAIGPGGALEMSSDVEWALQQPGICTLAAAAIVAAYAAGFRDGNAAAHTRPQRELAATASRPHAEAVQRR